MTAKVASLVHWDHGRLHGEAASGRRYAVQVAWVREGLRDVREISLLVWEVGQQEAREIGIDGGIRDAKRKAEEHEQQRLGAAR